MKSKTFIVADEQPLFRDGVTLLLQGINPQATILECDSLESLLARAGKNPRADLIFVSVTLPGAERFGGLEDLLHAHPGLAVMLVSATHDNGNVLRALKRGARGYILRSTSREIMRLAISLVLAGGTYVPYEEIEEGRHHEMAAAAAVASAGNTAFDGMTPRQRQILGALVEGLSNKEIARRFDLEMATVKSHVHAVMQKLGVKNRTQAALRAVELGFRENPQADLEVS